MKMFLTVTAISLIPFASFADGMSENYAVITAVHPIYQDRYVARNETVCRDVEVPIYQSQRSASDADVLAGAIVGGVIGNQFGGGSGKDAMTVLGAIVGANRASNRTTDVIVGYQIEERCERVSRRVNEPVISSYHIEYIFNGYTYRQETTREYVLGQRVPVQPALR
jgi:uncharacterized protein YcfJ